MLPRALAVVGLILGLCSWPFTSVAQQQPIVETTYCFETCHPTLHQAEAELRARSGPYGSLWTRKGLNHSRWSASSGEVMRYSYYVPDQEAAVLYEPGYRVDGNGVELGICTAQSDPFDLKMCANETEAVDGYMSRLKSLYPQCIYSDERYEGSYGSPYVTVRRDGSRGTVIHHQPTREGSRWYRYSLLCPGWGTNIPDPRELQLSKVQHFTCAEGFLPKDSNNPAYFANGTGLDWPKICRPTVDVKYIEIRNVKQTCSVPSTNNPCYPATGDKARSETDFSFAGRDFTRHYHSINQLQTAPELGAGWSHNYADALMTSRQVRVDESGYLQTYAYMGRGARSHSETLRAGATGITELIKGDGSIRSYRTDGKLVSVNTGDPASSVTVSYDSKARIDRIEDGQGRSLVFSYEQDRLRSITLPDGSAALYTYDPDGNLTGVVRPDGTSRTYHYAEAGHSPPEFKHLMTGISEEGVRYATFSYNEKGNVIESHLISGGEAVEAGSITYNTDGSVSTVNSLGEVKQHQIGPGQFRAITRTVDAQGTTASVYATNGRLSSKTDARGNRTVYAYADSTTGAVSQLATVTEESIGRTTRTTRDANNRVVEERVTQRVAGVEQLASLNRTVPNAQGRPLYSCQYDATQPTDYVCGSLALAPSNVRQTQNTYCTEADVAANPGTCPLVGLHRSTRDPAGNLTQFEYYAANDPGCDAGTSCTHRKGDLRAQINAIGQRTEILEYDVAGNAIRIQAIDGTETERLYDSMGRMVTETLKGDVPANDRISLFEYSSTGKMTKSTGPDGVWTRMHYDTADRLTSVEDALGNRIVYTLDGAGNRLKEEIRDTAGTLRKVMNRSFDTASRNTRIAGADGYATLLRYDGNGNVLETENAHGTIAKQTYDGVDRVLTEVQDLGGINAQVGYEYAINGQVAAVTDPKGLRTRYGYNGFGDQISLVSPDTGTTSFTVDINGNRKTKTDARGITATYHYDALNRLIGIGYPDPNLDVGYVYDTAPDVCAANERFAAGRVGYVQHEGGSTAYCYDRFGQLTRKVQTVNGVAATVRYGYTPGGQLAQLTYPDGSVADYQRDALGRVSEVAVTRPAQARQVVVTNVIYAPFGPATGWTYGNGRTLQRPVDQDYRTVAVNDPTPGGLSIGFGYDEVGDITELMNGGGTEVLAQYRYDALGHLTQTNDGVTGTTIEQYGYDASGNRTKLTTSAGTQVYAYAVNSHHLTALGGETRDYDTAGNTLSIGDREFIYGDSNRMAQLKRSGNIAEGYLYNHVGERIGLTSTAYASKYTLYDEAGQWLADYTGAGEVQQQAVWLDSIPVALLNNHSPATPGIFHIQPDHLGTPRKVVDADRDVAVWEWSVSSEVFGNQIPNDDPDGDGRNFQNALRFPGQQFGDVSGLSYNYQREYDPVSGRYTQSDPLGLDGGVGTYSYVEQSPLMAVDPKGLFSIYAYELYNGQWRFRFDFHQACILGDSPISHLDRGFQRIPYLGKVRKRQVDFERPTGDVDAVNKCACRAFDSELKAMFLNRGWTTGNRYGGGAYDEATANQIITAFREKVRQLSAGAEADCERCEIPWGSLIPKAKSRGARYIGNGVY